MKSQICMFLTSSRVGNLMNPVGVDDRLHLPTFSSLKHSVGFAPPPNPLDPPSLHPNPLLPSTVADLYTTPSAVQWLPSPHPHADGPQPHYPHGSRRLEDVHLTWNIAIQGLLPISLVDHAKISTTCCGVKTFRVQIPNGMSTQKETPKLRFYREILEP